MESINSEKWRVRAAIVGIFVLGAFAGGLTVNLYRNARASSSNRFGPFAHRGGGGFEVMLKSLNLNDQQKQQVEEILADTRQQLQEIHRASEPQMTDIRKQTRERLKAVLTEDQWNQFQQLLKQRESRPDRQDRQDHPDRPHRRPFLQDPSDSPTPTPQ